MADHPLHYNTTSVIAKSWTHIMVDTWVAIQFSFLLTDQESELDKDMLVPAVVVFDQWLGWDWTSRSTHSFATPSSYTDCTRAALLLSSHVNLWYLEPASRGQHFHQMVQITTLMLGQGLVLGISSSCLGFHNSTISNDCNTMSAFNVIPILAFFSHCRSPLLKWVISKTWTKCEQHF